MSVLTVYPEAQPDSPLLTSEDFEAIKEKLAALGVRFERWVSEREVGPEDDNESILSAYEAQIQALVTERGYKSWDVVSLNRDHPDKDAFRAKFLSEHTHSDDEVRFFVRGSGLFVMHIEDKVYSVLCAKDDLISVPADTKHWFDMGPNPEFTCIRVFNSTEGWVANFTGDAIADSFPALEN